MHLQPLSNFKPIGIKIICIKTGNCVKNLGLSFNIYKMEID